MEEAWMVVYKPKNNTMYTRHVKKFPIPENILYSPVFFYFQLIFKRLLK